MSLLGGGWYIPMMYSGLFWSIVFHSAYSVLHVWPDSTSVVLMFLWYRSTIPPPFLLPCQLCCCNKKFDCVRSDWLIHAWYSGVSLSHVSMSRPMSILVLVNSFTIISLFLLTLYLVWLVLLWMLFLFQSCLWL